MIETLHWETLPFRAQRGSHTELESGSQDEPHFELSEKETHHNRSVSSAETKGSLERANPVAPERSPEKRGPYTMMVAVPSVRSPLAPVGNWAFLCM